MSALTLCSMFVLPHGSESIVIGDVWDSFSMQVSEFPVNGRLLMPMLALPDCRTHGLGTRVCAGNGTGMVFIKGWIAGVDGLSPGKFLQVCLQLLVSLLVLFHFITVEVSGGEEKLGVCRGRLLTCSVVW